MLVATSQWCRPEFCTGPCDPDAGMNDVNRFQDGTAPADVAPRDTRISWVCILRNETNLAGVWKLSPYSMSVWGVKLYLDD